MRSKVSPARHLKQDSDNTISVAEMVLISTAEAANWTTASVPYGEIVVRAWRAFPEQFGLPNHPEFPDSSDVHKPLYRTLKADELVESLGNKTFRVTDLGLSRAKSIVSNSDRAPRWRRTFEINVCVDQTTQSIVQELVDAVGLDAESVARRFVAAVLALRFPADNRLHEVNVANACQPLAVGDTTFSVQIPMSLEVLQSWMYAEPAGGRQVLLVRDSVIAHVRRIVADSDHTMPIVAYGIESFLGQMIDGMAAYDGPRTAEILRSVIEGYNLRLPLDLPRLEMTIADCTRLEEG